MSGWFNHETGAGSVQTTDVQSNSLVVEARVGVACDFLMVSR